MVRNKKKWAKLSLIPEIIEQKIGNVKIVHHRWYNILMRCNVWKKDECSN